MKFIIPRVLLVLLMAAISGCSALSPSGPKFAMISQPKPSADQALVYVYRYTDGRWVGRVDVSLDGKEIAAIGDWEFSWCYLSPGNHTFRAAWGLMDKPMFEDGQFDAKTLSMKVESGKTYYLCYAIRENGSPTTKLESSGLVGKALSTSHVTSVELLPEDEAHALSVLQGCRFRESDLNK